MVIEHVIAVIMGLIIGRLIDIIGILDIEDIDDTN